MKKIIINNVNNSLLRSIIHHVYCLELKKKTKNYDLIKIRFIKVRLKRKMIGINERSAPQILCYV